MKFLYGIYGANIPVIREFDIPADNKFEAGEVVTMSTDNVISKNAIGPAVGVAAEDHRSNGTKLRIDITGGGVYSVPAIRLTATNKGTATSFICDDENINAGLSGAKLVLVSKGENSVNTDSVGMMRKVQSVSVSAGVASFVLDNGGVTDVGEVYALILNPGFKGYVSNDGKNFTCSGGSGINLTVMGYDEKTLTLEVLLGSKFYE